MTSGDIFGADRGGDDRDVASKPRRLVSIGLGYAVADFAVGTFGCTVGTIWSDSGAVWLSAGTPDRTLGTSTYAAEYQNPLPQHPLDVLP